jgi:hypothetical protein
MIKLMFLTAVLSLSLFAQSLGFPGPGTVASSGGGGACTPASGYVHCRLLTVNFAQVGGSTLTNYPVVTQNSGGALTLGASRITNANCYDVIFTSDSAGTTKIPWEIESCTQSSGVVVAWVKLASISASVNTLFYVSYDNSGISTAQNTGGNVPSNVWNSNYAGVWHIANNPTITFLDSTVNANNGTTGGGGGVVAATGQMDGAGSFAGSAGDNIFLNAAAPLQITSAISLSAWIKTTSTAGEIAIGSFAYSGSFNGYALAISPVTAGHVSYYGGTSWATSTGTVNDGSWHLIAASVTSGGTASMYIDGVLSGSFANTVPNAYTLAPSLGTSNATENGAIFIGTMDECRISNTNLPANWLAADFSNQNSSSTFLTVGSEI